MARNLNGSDQWLDWTPGGGLPINAAPFTLSMWVKTSVEANAVPWWMGDVSDANHWWRPIFNAAAGGGVWRGQASTGAGVGSGANTGNGLVLGEWTHVLFREVPSDHNLMLNGDIANKGGGGNTRTPANADTMAIGRANSSAPGLYWTGEIAEVAVWDYVLPDDWGVALFSGITPEVMPGRPVHYIPLGGEYGDNDRDRITGETFNVNGSPSFSDHPPGLIYPSSPMTAPAAAAAPAGTILPQMMQLSG